MKTIIHSLFMVCILFAGAAEALDDWTQQYPASKPSARQYQAMAYIGDDQVLLFGGYDDSNDDETWIYDVSANTWTQKFPNPHPSARREHALAYIGGDQVVLFGGYDGSNDDETWVYDLSANTWTQKSPVSKPSARNAHDMAYIGGDQVVLFGGYESSCDNETWIYDLSANTWTQKSPGSKPPARRAYGMAYIGTDQVLIFGGDDGYYNFKDDTWLYDLGTNTWAQQSPASKPSARWGLAMAYIGGDQVLLFGGEDAGGRDDQTWVFDLSEGNWSQDANTTQPSPRKELGLSESSMDGSSFPVLFGGYNGSSDDETWTFGDGDYLPVPEPPQVSITYPNGGETLIDSTTIAWTATDPDPGDSALLIVDLEYSDNAGAAWSAIDSGQANDGAYLWDLSGLSAGNSYLVRLTATDTAGLSGSDTSDAVFTIRNHDDWTEKYPSPKPSPRRHYAMAYIGEDRVLLFGGEDAGGLDDETWVYDLSADLWTQKNPSSRPSARREHAMAWISEDWVVLFGGFDAGGKNDETWVYDLSADTWSQRFPNPHPSARWGHAMVHLGWDEVLLFGGEDPDLLDDTWIYDMGADLWFQRNPNPNATARTQHAMAYLGELQVLMFGGIDTSGYDDGTWVLDLNLNKWIQTSPAAKPSARAGHAMAYIGGDQVLLFGGDGAGGLDDETWIYDLSDVNWSQDANTIQPSARWGHGLAETSFDESTRPVLFGGDDGSYDDETWTFGGGDYPLGYPPQVTVTYPNGGETLADSAIITWTATDLDLGETALLTIDLEYTPYGGGLWFPITTGEPNDGSYLWDISALDDGSNYLVRITATDTTGLAGADASDAAFAIYHPDDPSVTLTYPNGGETLADSVTITWTATDPDLGETALLSIDLDYSSNGGGSWSPMATGESNDGSYLWDTYSLSDGSNYLVRVTASDTTGLWDSDTSDAVFTIYNPDPPQVTVTYPNGGETLRDTATITWTATDLDSGDTALLMVDLDYSANGGDTWSVIDSGQVNDGAYLWDISGVSDGSSYLVRVTATDTTDLSGSDTCDAVFTIDNPDDDWTQMFPDPHPSARKQHAMAYIGEDQALLFGGIITGAFDDQTWIYDFSDDTWTQKSPSSRPSARGGHAMAYIGDDQVLLFGGSSGLPNHQTWVYDLSDNTWTLKSPNPHPAARSTHAMAYMGGDQVLLFGGDDGNYDDETWIYDLSANTWTQKNPVSKPSARREHAMAYIGGDQVLLFGGEEGEFAYDDETWIYDLSDSIWIQQSSSSKPSARYGHAMAYLGDDQVLLFGGADPSADDETWIYDLGDDHWTQDVNSTQPSPRYRHQLCETSLDGSTGPVLFGGDSGGYDDETWIFGDGDYLPLPDRPQVTVTHPNGGETLSDSATITWTATDADPGDSSQLIIDLEYSDNAGGSWSAIDSNQTNDGAYLWDISGLPDGTDYLVRITATDTTDLSGSDTSDAVFAIDHPDPPQVTVIYPNGGETLTGSATITWTATDPDPGDSTLLIIDLEYSDNAGATWSAIDSGQNNDGDYSWDISELPYSTYCLVRIMAIDTTDLSASDTSDAFFTIYPEDAADDWTQHYPSPKPSARCYHAMAYIGDHQVLLFGGDDGSDDDETWVYDVCGNTWTQKLPSPHPSARREHAMAYIGGDQVLLFAGSNGSDETWIYDLGDNTWTQKFPDPSPLARNAHAMAYIGEDKVLLFGGYSAYMSDTWIYDLSDSTWTQQSPVSKPSARRSHAMAYMGGDQVLLFGGETGGYVFSDETWIYDLSEDNWTQLSPVLKPSARWGLVMAYLGGDQVLLFGGADAVGRVDDTWIYDLGEEKWIQDANSIQPSPRRELGLVETSLDGSSPVVLFGGYDGSYDDETWTFGGGDYPMGLPQVDVSYPNGGEILTDSVTIAWMATDPDPGETALLMVDLDYSDNAGGSWSVIDSNQVNDGAYLWDISALPDDPDYLVRITVADTVGLSNSDISDTLFTIINTEAPAAISNLRASLSDSAIYLSWTAVTLDTAGAPIVVDHYAIYRNTAPDFSPVPGDSIGSTTDTFYFDTAAAVKDTGINHYYVVKALDFWGRKSADSNRVGEFDRDLITGP